ITRPVRTWNPIKINFQHVWLLVKDAWRTNNWKDKFALWFKHTGYRPADVTAKYPVYKIEDVYHFEKYDTRTSTALNAWSWIQMIMILLFVSYFFGNIALIKQLDSSYIFLYGAFIFLSVYALTELMDRNQYAIVWEIIRSGLGLGFIFDQGDWFGISEYFFASKYIISSYFFVSITITGLFVIRHRKEDATLAVA
ncbi:MAG TPA: sterol desaturase, partial [Chitinophagaceae bacterium]